VGIAAVSHAIFTPVPASTPPQVPFEGHKSSLTTAMPIRTCLASSTEASMREAIPTQERVLRRHYELLADNRKPRRYGCTDPLRVQGLGIDRSATWLFPQGNRGFRGRPRPGPRTCQPSGERGSWPDVLRTGSEGERRGQKGAFYPCRPQSIGPVW